MATSPVRLNPNLITAAEREGMVQKRSTPKQIEYWADLGRAVERVSHGNVHGFSGST